MAARPLMPVGPGQGPPRPGMMYPSQPQPQPVYHHQQRPSQGQPMPYMQHQQPPRPVYSTPQQQHQQQHYIPQHLQQTHQPHLQPAPFQNMTSPRAQFVHGPPPGAAMRPMMPIPQHQQHIQPQQQPIQQIRPAFSIGAQPAPPPPSSTPAGMPIGPGGPGGQYVLRTPSLSAAPVSMVATNPAFRPIIMRPPGVITAGPATVIASPGLSRMPVAMSNMRPVFIAAGPPSIIKNPSRTKALLERPVPNINIKQRTNTLLSNFWGDDIDVTKDGRVIDRSEAAKPESGKKQRSPRQTGIVVGIDFGNTFTGVSYAHQGDGEMIDVVKWPRHLNAYAKVPTVSLYKTNENKGFVDWGSSALASYKRSKADRVLIRDYKLLLFDQGARGRLENGLHLTDVFTQYIQSIHRHLMEEVNKSQVLAAESVPIHYCITVPQSWTLPTRELILRCYVEAGVILQTPALNMTVITEAEAAATYCREKCEEFESLKDGEIFMICDAGGLTTNVTVFRVDDGLGVRQFVRMSSSHDEDCGSVMLDRNFKNLVMKKLENLDIDAKPQRQKAFETLLEGFREIKAQFDGNSHDEIKHIPVPMGLDVKELDPPPSWLEEEYMSLKGQELCDLVFDPVIEKVQELINTQSRIHPVCAGLFMVGGFGANKYLLHKLTTQRNPGNGTEQDLGVNGKRASMTQSMADMKLSNGDGSPGVIKKVIMVQKAELAVARGAVIYGLKSASQHTKAFL